MVVTPVLCVPVGASTATRRPQSFGRYESAVSEVLQTHSTFRPTRGIQFGSTGAIWAYFGRSVKMGARRISNDAASASTRASVHSISSG